MKAMLLNRTADLSAVSNPLIQKEMPIPPVFRGSVLIHVNACGVCHTDIDEIEGRISLNLPVIPGHQVVGEVVKLGSGVKTCAIGDRVGVAWIFGSCGRCTHCRTGNENLCPDFKATGKDAHGGYAQYMVADADYVHPMPPEMTDAQAAPLLCAGAIGYRSLALTGLTDGQSLGLTGFGASGHLVLKLVRHLLPESSVYVFARSDRARTFARQLGAVWAGHIEQAPPRKLHAIIDTTPVWRPVVEALAHLVPGGRLVINAIRKEAKDQNVLLELDYSRHLWEEKEIKSVANVTRRDVREFLTLAARIPIQPLVKTYPLADANKALMDLKKGNSQGAKVLIIQDHEGP